MRFRALHAVNALKLAPVTHNLLAAFTLLSFLGGCTNTVTIPATELPNLSVRTVETAKDWPEVRTVDGATQPIIGTIDAIAITTPTVRETLYQPFTARIHGSTVEVWNVMGMRAYSLADKPRVVIEYADAVRTRGVVGGVLVGLGVPTLLFGGVAIAPGVNELQSSGSRELLLAALLMVTGGLSLVITGAVTAAYTPKKPTRTLGIHAPMLSLHPKGANLTLPF